MNEQTDFLGDSMSLGGLLLVGVALADLISRLGANSARFLERKGFSPLGAFGMRWLLGLVILGTTLLGIGLCNLCTRPVLWVVVILMTGLSRPWRSPRGWLLPALGVMWREPWSWRLLLIGSGGALGATLFSTSLFEDALVYHLAFPWSVLETHHPPLTDVPFVCHLPLLADLAFALPLCLGDDRLAKWMMAASMFASAALVADRERSAGRRTTAWLPWLMAISTPTIFWLPSLPKNDAAAIALLVGGAVLWRESRSAAGAILLGSAVAAKITCAPIVLAWFLFHPPGARSVLHGVLGLALPVLPWLIKSWLATANPLFPAFWRWLPSPFWGDQNQATLEAFGMWEPGAKDWPTLPGAWLKGLWREFPLCALVLPSVLLAGRLRAVAAFGLGTLAALQIGGFSRYMAPGIWLLFTEVPLALASDRKWRRRLLAIALLVGWCIQLRSGASIGPDSAALPAGGSIQARTRQFTTYGRAALDLGISRDRCILMTGGWRSYLLPGRVLFNGFWGETPIVWHIVSTSYEPERVRIRFHQLGVTAILHNYVSVDLVSSLQQSFPWTVPMLERYAAFCDQHMHPRPPRPAADRANGGFYIFDLTRLPQPGSSHLLHHLPGAEVAIAEGRADRLAGRHTESVRSFNRLGSIGSRVGYFASQIAEAHAALGEWRTVYRLCGPFVRDGQLDGTILAKYSEAATRLGYLDEAVEIWRLAIEVYDTDDANRVNLSWALQERAARSIASGRLSPAELDLNEARKSIELVPDDASLHFSGARRQVLALLYGTTGDLDAARGRVADALAARRRALELAPELPEAAGWKRQTRSTGSTR